MREFRHIKKSTPFKLSALVDTPQGSIESRSMVKEDSLDITMFGFDKGEGISAYTVPGDSLLLQVSGSLKIVINGQKTVLLQAGESITISSKHPFSVEALEQAKLLITLVK